MCDNLADLARLATGFRDERDWKQFHNPKDATISLCLEAAELLEIMQWRNGPDLLDHLTEHRAEVAEELSDVFYWVLILSSDLGIDLGAAFRSKVESNARKYPVDKARSRATKYTELR